LVTDKILTIAIFWVAGPAAIAALQDSIPFIAMLVASTTRLVFTICHHFMNCFGHFVCRRKEHSVEVVDITTGDRPC
jgi:hypothetical protein